MYNQATTKRLIAYVSAAALMSSQALAATQSVTANIAFDTPLTLTKDADIEFGIVKAGVVGSHTINTAGTVSSGGAGVWLSGSPHAGQITIAGSTTQTLSISMGSYVADGSSTPSAGTCAYNGGGAGACSLSTQAAPGAGKILLIGIKLDVDGSAVAGDADAPTTVVTVTYT